jgi:hypothetical protein
MDEGIDVFETAGNNRMYFDQLVSPIAGPLIKLLQTYKPAHDSSTYPIKRYIIHKCVTIRHALSGQKMGVDCLSIDGFECKSLVSLTESTEQT